MRNLLTGLLFLIGTAGLFATEKGPFSLNKQMVLQIEKDCALRFIVSYKSEKSKWDVYTQSEHSKHNPQITENGKQITGVATMRKNGLPDSRIVYTEISPNEREMFLELIPPEKFTANFMALELALPMRKMLGKTLTGDNAQIVFPVCDDKDSRKVFGKIPQTTKLDLPLSQGIFHISSPQSPLDIVFQQSDASKANKSQYLCKINIPVKDGKRQITLRLRYEPYMITPVPLRPCANRTFADPVADDRQGGWTDQGPEQDMSPLKPGKLTAAPAYFDIAGDRDGNSCLVLGGGGLQWLPLQAELKLPSQKCGSVFLLHSMAWIQHKAPQEIGKLSVKYTDGSQQVFPVSSLRDAGDWWNPSCSFPNGIVAWKDKILNLGEWREVGLYMSVFHIDSAKTVDTLQFVSNGKSVWMVAGVSLAAQKVQMSAQAVANFQLTRSNLWRPYKPCLEVEENSALDLSFLQNPQDRPAGKYGWLTAGQDGTFRFGGKPDAPFRIWGTNLCFGATVLQKADAEKLVKNLAAFGYNAVRLHHFDVMLTDRKITNKILPERLDVFHYMLSLLRKAGIYYTLDLYTARRFDVKTAPDAVWDKQKTYFTGLHKDRHTLATLALKSFRDDMKEFTRNLLLPVNPYTGLAIKDDPALLSLSVLNENSVLVTITHPLSIEKEQLLRAFDRKLSAQGRKLTGKEYDLGFRRFTMETYWDYYNEMKKFLREEIKTPVIMTDQNFLGYPNLTFQRLEYDFVDEHMYSGANNLQKRLGMFNGSARRVFGKPFQVSETNSAYPAPTRGDVGLIFPAMAALQNWDGIYRFAHSHRRDSIFSPKTGLEMWDMVNDPVRNIPERIAAMIFRRRDVAPLQNAIPTVVGYESSFEPFQRYYPKTTTMPLFSALTGSVAVAADGKSFLNPIPAKTQALINISTEYKGSSEFPTISGDDAAGVENFARRNRYPLYDKDNTVTSATGEISVDFNKRLFRLVTPRTEGLFFETRGKGEGKILTAESTGVATIAATSLDHKPLIDSGRILLIHVTDMQNEGNIYTDEKMLTIVESVHKKSFTTGVQILYRVARAPVSLKTNLKNPVVYALDCGGRRLGKIPARFADGSLNFTADTDYQGTACFCYEIVNDTK